MSNCELVVVASQARDAFECVSARVIREMERFKREKAHDMRPTSESPFDEERDSFSLFRTRDWGTRATGLVVCVTRRRNSFS